MLYHVSFSEIRGSKLYPRVPNLRGPGEDATIKRICFSSSMEKCITAMPSGGQALKGMLRLSEEGIYLPILHVYTIEEEEIPHENVWGPETVKEFVEDASCTRETWVVNQEVVCCHEMIQVESAEIVKRSDPHGKEIYIVKNVQWTPITQIPSHLISKTAEYLMSKIGWEAEKMRTCLAWLEEDKRALVL